MRSITTLLAATLIVAAPATAFAFGGAVGGCADLPEHDRAVGALEGMTSACDMSVEQAQRILARDAGQTVVAPDGAPPPRHRRHRRARAQR